ncbi:YceI family protein [Amycolatopsis sp. cmx-4-54]|uniref:YceI family protein n=1 Tax=Amycolatopsis sp. cmx-4-54 TaxID=2790936 RepID=UPI00397DA0BA
MSTMTALSELTGDYVLDTAHTRIGFIARHTMATRVWGQFEEFEGSAHLDGDEPSKSSAQLSIQAKSIQTRNEQRDVQLGSRFLNADDHPAITFTSIGMDQVGKTTFKVAGDLTIRGVTETVIVDFELTGTERDRLGYLRVTFRGSATISRRDWGVNWNAATSVLVGRKVTLELDVAAIRQS